MDVLTEGVHSGLASGIVASSFRILRNLLSRLEDEQTGEILPSACHAPIPTERVTEAEGGGQGTRKDSLVRFAIREGYETDLSRWGPAAAEPRVAPGTRGDWVGRRTCYWRGRKCAAAIHSCKNVDAAAADR